MGKKFFAKPAVLFVILTAIIFIIFENVHFTGSILINNLLWLAISLSLIFALPIAGSKDVGIITKTVAKMADGDLTHKVAPNKGRFAQLCSSINLFLLKVRKLINESTTMTDKVINHCEDLSKNANLAKIAADETYSVISEVASEMEVQRNGSLQAATIIDGIINEYKDVTHNGTIIEDLSSSMIHIIQESIKIYEDLAAKLNESAASNNSLAAKITQLNEKAFQIQSIADKVNEISKNTNLLSLNASIEAARAHKTGSGFAVVAEEIRKLSTASALQAKEIQKIIDDIKIGIADISSHMNKELAAIYKNVESSNVTKKNLHKIFEESQNTLKSIKDINQIINKQNTSIFHINEAINQIAAIAKNTTAATQQVSFSAKNQLTAIGNVFDSISNLTEMNRDLKKNISSFAQNYIVTAEIQNYIEDGLKILKELSQQQSLAGMDYKACTKVLTENIKSHPYFELLALMDKRGLRKAITLDYTEEEVYVNFSHRPYFKEAIQGKSYKSEPYISVDTNNYCIAISVPVAAADGNIVGILMGDLILG